jgi:uncharacterized protein with gpF-like domain
MGLPSNEFWQREALRFWNAIDEIVLAAILAGVHRGIQLLPKSALPLVRWDFVNQAAIDYLRQYQLSVVQGISETTRRQATQAIADWMRSGEHLDVLITRLNPIFGESRAESIAVTEVTRALASGNLAAWKSTGVVEGKRWRTAVDERVCPICRPLHMSIVEINGGWTFTMEMLANNEELAKALRGATSITYLQPPAHPGCRCVLSPVVFDAHTEEQLEEQRFK